MFYELFYYKQFRVYFFIGYFFVFFIFINTFLFVFIMVRVSRSGRDDQKTSRLKYLGAAEISQANIIRVVRSK